MAVRGIASGSLVVRNEDNLAVLGVKPKGVAAKGAVVYRAKAPVPAGKWQLIATASAPTNTVTLNTTGANIFIIATSGWGSMSGVTGDSYGAQDAFGAQGLGAVLASGAQSTYIGVVAGNGKSGPSHTWTTSLASRISIHVAAFYINFDPGMVFSSGSGNNSSASPGSITSFLAEPLIVTVISAADSNPSGVPAGYTLIGSSQAVVAGSRMGSAAAYLMPPASAGTGPFAPVWSYGGGAVASSVAQLTQYAF